MYQKKIESSESIRYAILIALIIRLMFVEEWFRSGLPTVYTTNYKLIDDYAIALFMIH